MTMLMQAHSLSMSAINAFSQRHWLNPSSSLCDCSFLSSKSPFNVLRLNVARKKRLCWWAQFKVFSSTTEKWNCCVSRLNGAMKLHVWNRENRGVIVAASAVLNSGTDTKRKRKVVEHICLLKAKEELSDDEEKNMLDYLYTSQYQMGGIVAVSLGHISDQNSENYTHAVYMRFQRKEDLLKFYKNSFYLDVLKEHVMPYCHVCPNIA